MQTDIVGELKALAKELKQAETKQAVQAVLDQLEGLCEELQDLINEIEQ